jgi:hypothetical protein
MGILFRPTHHRIAQKDESAAVAEYFPLLVHTSTTMKHT